MGEFRNDMKKKRFYNRLRLQVYGRIGRCRLGIDSKSVSRTLLVKIGNMRAHHIRETAVKVLVLMLA